MMLYSIKPYIQPFDEPVALDEAKNHLKQDSDITTDDELIKGLITAARVNIETATGRNSDRMRVMVATTFDMQLTAGFPGCRYIRVPRVPLVSVESITYTDTDGNTQTMSSSLYTVDKFAGRIDLAYGEVWPSTLATVNPVTVRFIAGLAAGFSAATSDVCTVRGRTYSAGDRLRVVTTGGTIPTGLSVQTDYFVVSPSGSTFNLAATAGGAAIDITGAGSGTNFLTEFVAAFVTLRAAIKLELGKLYYNRGDAGVEFVDRATQNAIDSLVASTHA